ncbi:MAG TPA: M1 family metallopeptidase [Longimicrobiaceae bacterium]|nr:M1 family metallopeptidase [Longimicrobiaceae bacterium]
MIQAVFRSTPVLAALLALAACTPFGRPATGPGAGADTATRELLRPVPVPASYAAALARGTRSPTGAPGDRYWQQRVSYRIDAELDPATALLRGRERIVYRNLSPVPLTTVVLNLYQNLFSEGVPRNRYAPITGGFTLERVAAQGQPLTERPVAQIPVVTPREGAPVGYAVQGTLARLVLPRAVAPGDSAVLEVEWRHRVPPAGAFRTAYEDALGGRVLQVAQWYPQVAVFDDVHGWDATPYLGDGEFYLEYGDFDVSLTLPAGWLVGASGTLRNPEQVLTPEAQARLAALASGADSAVQVVGPADLAAGRVTQGGANGKVTWRFHADSVRDFAFAASDRYVWEAVRASVAGEGGAPARPVLVHSLYRPGAPGWEDADRYAEHALEFFSRQVMPYAYPQLTVSEGPIYGMEYPGLVFIARPTDPKDLYAVIAHEVAHQWFPMMVGQNEAAYAWMDEGFATFMENRAREDFYPGDRPFLDEFATYVTLGGTEREVPLMRHTDLVSPYGARGFAAYTKPALLLRSLEGVVGDTVFARALRTYAREWRFKHPYPWDFFDTVERVSGRDLDWFWYPWWWETGTLDYAIEAVDTSQPGTVRVTVRDLGEIPAPIPVVVTADNGATTRADLPVELWTEDRLRTATLSLPVYGRAVRVQIDPEFIFPDVNPLDNLWTADAQQAGGRQAAGER